MYSRTLAISIPGLLVLAMALGQSNPTPQGLPEDWSHHHLVFSNPGTEADAIKDGSYPEWVRITNDPRYIMQQLKRRLPVQGAAAEAFATLEEEGLASAAAETGAATAMSPTTTEAAPLAKKTKTSITKDWSMVLGGSATVGAGMYPAKYSFSLTATPTCGSATAPDFVVYNTSAAGSSSQASIVAYYNLYSSCSGQVPSVYWAFNTGGTVKTSVVFSYDGSQLAFIQTPTTSGNAQLVLLRWKATPAGRNVTGTPTTGKNFSVSATTPLTSMDVGAEISGTGIPTGDTIATVTGPTTGTLTTAATAHASETLAITADAGGPDTLTALGAGSYFGCGAPCMTALSFSGTSRTDNISSPFYDYNSDTLYVGDAQGGLHKFHPVFNGTPAEVGTPWAAVSSTALSSPVYDPSGTGNVFVGDASGYLYSVNSSGVVVKSVQVATAPGIEDSPLLDVSNNQLYAFVAHDNNSTNSSTSPCADINSGDKTVCNGVINLPTTFTASTEYTESTMGVGTTNTLYAGAFDNLYWTSGTGHIYTNGATGSNEPKLMEIPITTSGFSTDACQSGTGLPANASAIQCSTNIVNPMTSAAAGGSPVTEILNGSTDYIFGGVTGSSSITGVTGCATGNACVFSWITTSALGSGAAPDAGATAAGGTSGIIIDNTSSAVGGASNIYYSTLGTTGTCTTSGTVTSGGCAVQISQSGL
jgi:hypothetical protein